MNKILNVNTAAVGTDWTALSSTIENADLIRIHNTTGVTIDYRMHAGGVEVSIPDGQVRTIFGIYDASKIAVKRKDSSNTQVEVQAEVILF